jgi:hypothetical protein
LYKRNVWGVIKEFLEDPNQFDRLKLGFSEEYQDGERIYGSLNNGLWFEVNEKDVKSRHPDGKLLPVLLFTDEKNVRTFGTLKFHPVLASVGLLSAEERLDFNNWKFCGYIPVLKFPESFDAEKARIMKHRHFQNCLAYFLEDLEEPSTLGVYVTPLSKDGQEQSPQVFFPRFCKLVCDIEEAYYFWDTLSTNQTNMPCGTCLKLNTQLNNPNHVALRTVSHMTHARKEGKTDPQVLKLLSLKTPENILYQYINPHIQRAPDQLHQFHLGRTPTFITDLHAYLAGESHLKHLIRSLDLTFTELKIPELRQFPDGIWSLKHLKAAEYEELLFQLPFAMEFANFPKSLITIPVAFLLRFSLLISRTKLKISEIREMEKEAINPESL